MGRPVGIVLSLLVALAATRSARAQTDDETHRLRARVGVSLISGLVEVPYDTLKTDPTVAGVAGRFGVQISDQFAIYDQASFTAFWLQLRDVVFFEWTPSDYFSIGVGPAIEWLADIRGSADSDWSLGGALRAAVHVPFSRGERGRRRAISFAVEVTPSYAFAGSNTYSMSGFQLGVLGAVGLELY